MSPCFRWPLFDPDVPLSRVKPGKSRQIAANGAGGLYGLTITPTGEIWVTITGENIIARLDVAAHHFIYYPIPTPGSLPFGLVMGANHTIWFTEAGTNKIGMLKP